MFSLSLPSGLNNRIQFELLAVRIFADPDSLIIYKPTGRNRQIVWGRNAPKNPPGQIVFRAVARAKPSSEPTGTQLILVRLISGDTAEMGVCRPEPQLPASVTGASFQHRAVAASRPDGGAKPDRRNRARRYEEEIASTLCLHSGLRCVRFHDGLILSPGSHPGFNGERRQDRPTLRQSSAVSTLTNVV